MKTALDDIMKHRQAEVKRRLSWGTRAARRLKKMLGDSNSIYASHSLAAMLDGIEHKGHIVSNHINWTMEYYVGSRLWALMPDLRKIHGWLTVNKHTEKNKFSFNDLDNGAFVLPSQGERQMLVITTQNVDYLYIFEGGEFSGELHVRRLYRDIPKAEDKWEKTEQAAYKKGIQYAAGHHYALEEYSDDYSRNQYIHRPSLRTFKKWKFNLRYKDGRDPGYVISVRNESFMCEPPRADNAIYFINHINRVAFEIQSLSCVIDEENA